MSTFEDVESALHHLYACHYDIPGSSTLSYDNLVRKDLQSRVSVLHCTSIYSCPLKFINLRCITTLIERFSLVTTLPDHSAGLEVALAAADMGARVI
ncbi:MAG: N-acetylneuraminate synthase family protein [Candidatus Obscuribacter sp.]|nr:N-acetylneuraminate synthase family protein [Candidatus Obscuribacter sp.]